MDLVLGIDLGTSYFKLALFDRDGELRGLGRAAIHPETGDGTRCELPVERFWSALREGLDQALDQARAKAQDVTALAYASQANSFLLLDERDQPLTPLVLWPDLRAGRIDDAVRELWDRDDFLRVTGLGVRSAEFCIAKLQWFRRRRPELWARSRRIRTISDYLVHALTGQARGDEGTASLLGIWDLRNHAWWADALEMLGLSLDQLSCPLPPGSFAGRLTEEGAERLGLATGTPLAVGSLDHHVAAMGAGVGLLAPVAESTGTVLAALRYTEELLPHPGCCCGPQVGGRGYYVLAFDGNGAGVLEWYAQNHAAGLCIEELTCLAEAVPPGSDGLIALPLADRYPGLEGFQNRTPQHHHGHFASAIMESVAVSLAGMIDRLCPAGRPGRIVATGGGARSDLWLRIKADLLGAEFLAPACPEPACLGAAMIAAQAAGWFERIDQAIAAWSRVGRTIRPDPARRCAYADWHRNYLRTVRTQGSPG